jgi:hypothetical protein
LLRHRDVLGRCRFLGVVLLCPLAITHADDVITEPLPKQSYVRLEPSYGFLGSGGRSSELHARGLLVYRGLFVPGLDPDRTVSGVVADLGILHESTSTLHATGLTDLELNYVSGIRLDDGAFGGGVAVLVPTATVSAFGNGTVGVGPACFGQLTAISHLELSILARSFFSVTGSSSRSTEFFTKLQPSAVVSLPDGYLLSSDGEIEIDWLAHSATVPVNLEIAHLLGDHVLLQVGPEIEVAGRERGAVRVDVRIDYLAP